MIRHLISVSALGLLVGCNGTNPFFETGNEPTEDTVGEVVLPPSVEEPSPVTSITRYEPRNLNGGGYAENIVFNANGAGDADDTFEVDNLAFDGLNTYDRSTVGAIKDIGGFELFNADVSVPDFLTNNPVPQVVPYAAIYGRSPVTVNVDGQTKPRTEFAIVRSGGYIDYGFGGFVYTRNGEVVLPPDTITGQAGFTGRYAGLRVFNGISLLELTEGDMTISIDFDDFNANNAIAGHIFNRVAYLPNGSTVLLGNDTENGQLPLPDLHFIIQEGVDSLNEDGEIAGQLSSAYLDMDGKIVNYEAGYYYGIIAGDMTSGDGGEIVGVFVIESNDPRNDGTAQETGGFLLLRN